MGNRRKEKRAAEREKRESKLIAFLGTSTEPNEPVTTTRPRVWSKGQARRATAEFTEGRQHDSDERIGSHARPTDLTKSVNAPANRWVDVPKGMVAAPDTFVDSEGVLRSAGDSSCVVWHNGGGGCGPSGNKGDYLKGIEPVDIIYDDKGAPWCPKCFAAKTQAELKLMVAHRAVQETEQAVLSEKLTNRERLMKRFPSIQHRQVGPLGDSRPGSGFV